MRSKWFFLLVATLATASLWGCGSSGGSGGSAVTPTDEPTVDTLGIVNCVKCHSSATPETDSWLRSVHGNGNGSIGYLEPHEEGSSCQPCHNQLLEIGRASCRERV